MGEERGGRTEREKAGERWQGEGRGGEGRGGEVREGESERMNNKEAKIQEEIEKSARRYRGGKKARNKVGKEREGGREKGRGGIEITRPNE